MTHAVFPLSAADIRAIARTFGKALAELAEGHRLPKSKLTYDEVFEEAARIMIENGGVFDCVVWCGTRDLSLEDICAMEWGQVVKLGCKVIEVTREAWREAWPNGFLQNIICEELAPHIAAGRGLIEL